MMSPLHQTSTTNYRTVRAFQKVYALIKEILGISKYVTILNSLRLLTSTTQTEIDISLWTLGRGWYMRI